MKFIFVDAENTGPALLEAIQASISDKVLVYSKSENVKTICERKLFIFNSSYPQGSNQADFYIIGDLVGIIMSLTEEQRKVCRFTLFTEDNALKTAFTFQCKLHKAPHNIAPFSKAKELEKKSCTLSPKKESSSQIPALELEQLEKKILKTLSSPKTAESARTSLKLTSQTFNKAFQSLIRKNKIQRDKNARRNGLLNSIQISHYENYPSSIFFYPFSISYSYFRERRSPCESL